VTNDTRSARPATDAYLSQLREALRGADPALIQEALYDANEFLRSERAERPEAPEEELVADAVRRFGSPAEIAEAYLENDARVAAAIAPPRPEAPRSWPGRLFGVLADPRAYLSLFYLLLAVWTGMFTSFWVAAGLSLSVGLALLIFGVPFFLLFLGSTRAIALAEGRLVESLLGTRMPRRPPLPPADQRPLPRIRFWLRDRRTWTTILYLVLLLPLGLAYFAVFSALVVLSLGLLVSPVAALTVLVFRPEVTFAPPSTEFHLALAPVTILAGLGLLLATLHLARLAGRGHGALARRLLVEREAAATPATGRQQRVLVSSRACRAPSSS